MTAPTDQQLIEAYLGRRDHLAAMSKEFDAQCEPFKDQMKTIENEMQRRLLERGANHSSTDAGTAYQERSMAVKCVDRPTMLRWMVANFEQWGEDFLTASVSKDTLNLYIEKTKDEAHPDGQLPPGLTVSYATKVLFRKG